MATNSKAYNRENYSKYWGHPSAVTERSERNKARRKVIRTHGAEAVQGKEVHHKHGVRAGNHTANLSIVSRYYNRQDGARKANRRKYAKIK